MRLSELRPGDFFYFANDVSLNAFSPVISKWQFEYELRPGVFVVSEVDQAGHSLSKPNAEKAGDMLVVRIAGE